MKTWPVLLGLLLIFFLSCKKQEKKDKVNPELKYEALQKEYGSGWNTWNFRSVFSHVMLPETFSINLGFKDYLNKDILTEAMLGYDREDLVMGPHAWDGSYTRVDIKNWSDIDYRDAMSFRIQSAHEGDDLIILVEPTTKIDRLKKPLLLIQTGIPWNRSGTILREGDKIIGQFSNGNITVYTTGKIVEEYYVGGSLSPYLAVSITGPIGISTGKERNLDEIRSIVNRQRARWEEKKASYGSMGEMFDAIQTGIAWNVVFDPKYNRVISPVSRRWSFYNRGYVLYCWDTYFAAYQAAATGSREMAYINLVEMTKAKDKAGTRFVPNVEQANGFISRDRSQPPVGSLAARAIYGKFREKWILELVYDDLLEWNKWWYQNRRHNGLLCYGSTPYEPVIGFIYETGKNEAVNGWFGASMESGWDGAVLYEEVPFDKNKHILKHWDASLNGLYVMDCRALADIADVLEKPGDAEELRTKAKSIEKKLQRLWNQEAGFFYNRNWETQEFSKVTAINGFYPLIAGAATDEQAKTIIKKYFNDTTQFGGKWILPTLSKSHPEFKKQKYWDGRIWPPVNFLVYLGLRNYDHIPEVDKAKRELVEKSRALLLKDWKAKRYVRENYDPATGSGDEAKSSARFYHWGGLLGLMSMVEEGTINAPDQPLEK